jgi:hypothetical protein
MKQPEYLQKAILLCFVILITAFTAGDTKSEYTIPNKAESISVSDFDMDGDKDIIIGHLTAWQQQNPTVTILTNNSNGNFEILDTSMVFTGYQKNIFSISLNTNNYPDLVTFYSDYSTGNLERYIRIYYNESGEYNNFNNFSLNSSETFITINYGDINEDGFIDLVVVSNTGKFWGVLYNDGTANFSLPEYHSVQNYNPFDIACGDLNADGRDDIVIGGKTEIFFSFESGFQSLFLNVITGDVETVDFDNDGDIDIIGAHQPLPSNLFEITMIENLGGEEFLVHDPYHFQPVCHSYFAVSDFDNDSLPDLLFHPIDDENLLIFYNNGEFDFSDSIFIPLADYGEAYRRSACADFDGNGYNDIATIRSWGAPLPGNLNIFYNDGEGNFVDNPITYTDFANFETETSNLSCYPNPFSNKTTIKFILEKKGNTLLQVYNMNGELIKTVLNQELQKGEHNINWNCIDKFGKEVNTGIYIFMLVSGRQNETCRTVKN